MSSLAFFSALFASEVSRALEHRREMQRLKFLADREALHLLDDGQTGGE